MYAIVTVEMGDFVNVWVCVRARRMQRRCVDFMFTRWKRVQVFHEYNSRVQRTDEWNYYEYSYVYIYNVR